MYAHKDTEKLSLHWQDMMCTRQDRATVWPLPGQDMSTSGGRNWITTDRTKRIHTTGHM